MWGREDPSVNVHTKVYTLNYYKPYEKELQQTLRYWGLCRDNGKMETTMVYRLYRGTGKENGNYF